MIAFLRNYGTEYNNLFKLEPDFSYQEFKPWLNPIQ